MDKWQTRAAWWGVYPENADVSECVAVFKYKEAAEEFLDGFLADGGCDCVILLTSFRAEVDNG